MPAYQEIAMLDWATGAGLLVGSVASLSTAILERRAPLRRAFWLLGSIVLLVAGAEEISDLFGLAVPSWADADEAKFTLSAATPFALAIFAALYRLRGWSLRFLFAGLAMHVTHLLLLQFGPPTMLAFMSPYWRWLREASEAATIQIYLAMMVVVIVAIGKAHARNPKKARETWQETIYAVLRRLGTWTIAHILSDFRFAVWRDAHPNAGFGEYYAEKISGKIAGGGFHRTLGARDWSPQDAISRSDKVAVADLSRRGSSLFQTLLQQGIEPSHFVLDYGCGSLRVGQHLIEYLQPGRYHGADVSRDFYLKGLERIAPERLLEKRPMFSLVSELPTVNLWLSPPDFIIATSVLQHVPPNELSSFGRKLSDVRGPRSAIILTYHRAAQNLRTAAMSWAYDDASVRRSIDPQSEMSFVVADLGSPRHAGGEDWSLALAVFRPRSN